MRRALIATIALVALTPPARASYQETFLRVLGDCAFKRDIWAGGDREVVNGARDLDEQRRAAQAELAANKVRWKREVAYFLARKHDYPQLAALVERPYVKGRDVELSTADSLYFSSRARRARIPAVQNRFSTAFAVAIARIKPGRGKLSAALAAGEAKLDFEALDFDLDPKRLDAEIDAARARWMSAPEAQDRAFFLALFAGLSRGEVRHFSRAIELAFEQHAARRAAAVAAAGEAKAPAAASTAAARVEADRQAEIILSEQVRWLMNTLPDRHLSLLRTAVIPRFAEVPGEYAANIRAELESLAP